MTTTKIFKVESKDKNGDSTTREFSPSRALRDFMNNLDAHKQVKYSKDEVEKQIRIKRFLRKGKSQKSGANENEIEEMVSDFYDELQTKAIFKWNIVDINHRKDDAEIHCTFNSDYVEFYQFHSVMHPYPQTFLSSFRAAPHNGKIILFLFAPYPFIDRAATIIREMFEGVGLSLYQVKWDQNGLSSVIASDATRTIYGAFHGIDQDNTGSMKGSHLESSPTYQGLSSQGELFSTSYLSNSRGNNRFGINGEKGLLSSDLDEQNTIDYALDILIAHSNF